MKLTLLEYPRHLNKKYNREPFEEDNYVIISSSRNNDIHRQGVAFILKKEFANGLMNYHQISERILSIEIEIESGLLTIFQNTPQTLATMITLSICSMTNFNIKLINYLLKADTY